MIFSARASTKDLARLSRRMATSLEAGIDARQALSREADAHGSPALRQRLGLVRAAVAQGRTIGEGLEAAGDYFPPMFREMVHVGEQTGKTAEVFRQLAEHYDYQLNMRRAFLAAIAWPMLQLIAALTVVGIVILVLGMIPTSPGGQPIDILGFGLIGVRGFVIYLGFVGAAIAAIVVVYMAIQRGMLWTRPLQRAVMQIPWLGQCLQTLALSRMAWCLHVTMDTSMDMRRALALSLAGTRNARYTDHTEDVVRRVGAGREVYDALAETGAFPPDFLDTLAVGERSGRLPESMAVLSRQYQDQARRALATLAVLAGFAVWGLVALLIIFMIFRVFSFYLGALTEAGRI